MKLKVKSGETLIEVMLAMAILSIVAVSVVSTMVNGTFALQTTLESTMARNEIDAQAEALRYIQSSYIAERDDASAGDTYTKLWKQLTANAISASDAVIYQLVDLDSCATLYDEAQDKSIKRIAGAKSGFIINTRKIGQVDGTIVKYNKTNFKQASLYPRVVYTNESDSSLNVSGNNVASSALYAAEGIYIIVVSDAEDTIVATDGDSSGTKKGSAYYDFYIRTCSQGLDAAPNLISTVVRLYDPDVSTVKK